jgi:oligoendopeptidase F
MSIKTGAEAIRWDLSDLFSSITDPQIDISLKESLINAERFQKKYKGTLATLSATDLKNAYQECESLIAPLYKVSQYASLCLTTDTSNDDIKSLDAKIDDIQSEVSNFILFFDLEVGTFTAAHVKKLEKDPGFSNYAYNLSHSFHTAKYNLSEKEEKIINLKDITGSDAFQKLYSEYVSAFSFEFEIDGKVETMNGSQLRNLRLHKDPELRRRAMTLFFSKYEENKIVLTHIFNNIVKDYNAEKKLRGYASAISIRNTGNDLDDESVQVLHEVTTESNKLVQRYYKLKKKILNRLTLADIYAPMPSSDKRYTFDEAKKMVLDGFRKFDEEFYMYAKQMFDENRIDAPISKTKRGGAFCSASTPDIAPYVMLNFQGKSNDVSTMAHELGHAIHDFYASKQSLFNFHPILPLAETASVFSEMLITDLLLENASKDEKQAILVEKLEDIFATSHRQNMFSNFEMKSHATISDRLMSTEDLCNLYQEELKNMFGDSVEITDEYKWEWSTIPHIYEWPFYVYAYNFGNLLVMSLYQQYKEEGPSFSSKLKAVLSAGSVDTPKNITALVNADINDKDFWKKSLAYIESLLNQLEELVHD